MSGNGSVHNVEPPNILKELLGLIQSLADGDDYNRSLERTYQLVNVDPNTFPSAFASALDYVFTLKEVRYKSFTETMIRYSVAVLTYVAAPSIDPVEAPVREQVSTALFTYFIERASSADKHTRKKACEVLKSVVTSAARDTELGAVIHELIRVASQRLQDADGSIRKDAYDLAWTLRQRLVCFQSCLLHALFSISLSFSLFFSYFFFLGFLSPCSFSLALLVHFPLLPSPLFLYCIVLYCIVLLLISYSLSRGVNKPKTWRTC